jgi:hypothetical protein
MGGTPVTVFARARFAAKLIPQFDARACALPHGQREPDLKSIRRPNRDTGVVAGHKRSGNSAPFVPTAERLRSQETTTTDATAS